MNNNDFYTSIEIIDAQTDSEIINQDAFYNDYWLNLYDELRQLNELEDFE